MPTWWVAVVKRFRVHRWVDRENAMPSVRYVGKV